MNRRDFLSNTTAASVAMALGGGTAYAADKDAPAKDAAPARPVEKPKTPPVNVAVIGLGAQGRAILESLSRPAIGAQVVAICDTFTAPALINKSKELVKGNNANVTVSDDYKKVLDDKNIQAVFIATPSHKHKQIVLDALAAGKHVYCEAPLAVDLAEAKEMAKAGMAAKTVFQPGLQFRSNMQYKHVFDFVKGKDLGKVTMARAQYHNRTSWRAAHPNTDRQAELNWRLSKATSLGLMGEVGIHQLDTANWFLNSLPTSITGTGGILGWPDGRDVQDTVQCLVEYPNGLKMSYDASLTNGFDGVYDMYYGTSGSVQMRDQRAWMFKEADAVLVGWEVFARHDDYIIGKPQNSTGLKMGVGIALVADASKQLALGLQPGTVGTDVSQTSIYQSLDGFLDTIRANGKPWVNALQGYQANVVAAKASEACLTGSKIMLTKEMFEI